MSLFTMSLLRSSSPLPLVLVLPALVSLSVRAEQGAPPPAVEEPTEAQIETAYAARIADINERSRAVLGDADADAMHLTLEALNKLRCRGLDRVGVHFDCRVELRLRQADRRPKTDLVDLWLSFEDSRWVAR